ncbi:hypothetical protein EUX98_g3652 [Antrodiella citrinella]|uniref:Ubiquitin-like domain-containing protein n=1 Tax=Antrodiella citrinella TaxID=2447956 RepID=A0A4V3XIU9_9APHY|nr:hypothetical protein EUX98_g3652 [Antrodiella citrinella]
MPGKAVNLTTTACLVFPSVATWLLGDTTHCQRARTAENVPADASAGVDFSLDKEDDENAHMSWDSSRTMRHDLQGLLTWRLELDKTEKAYFTEKLTDFSHQVAQALAIPLGKRTKVLYRPNELKIMAEAVMTKPPNLNLDVLIWNIKDEDEDEDALAHTHENEEEKNEDDEKNANEKNVAKNKNADVEVNMEITNEDADVCDDDAMWETVNRSYASSYELLLNCDM